MNRAGPPRLPDLVVAMTGASGAPYAVRLLQILSRLDRTVHLTISASAVKVLHEEMGLEVDLDSFNPRFCGGIAPDRLVYHHYQDFNASIASGSFPTGGMVVIPCSMSTLGAIAGGTTSNLITRAADVHLKERRKLILVPRETPLSLIHLENMVKVTRAGAVVLPAMPGWYHRPRQLRDLIDFVVAPRLRSAWDSKCSGPTLGYRNSGAMRSSRLSGTPRSTSTRPSETRSPEIEPMAMDASRRQGPAAARVILITGASAGLGKELAHELVRQNKAGALVLTARRIDRLEELASELKEARPGLADLDGCRRPRRSRRTRTPGRRDDAPIRGHRCARQQCGPGPADACSKTPSPNSSLASSRST